MQFIKKLVILSGSGARGTLMLEKNGYGVWCKLTIFGLRPSDNYRFVILSDDLFVMGLDSKSDQTVNFELGEISFDEIHAAVVSDKVVMYGSNCANKLPFDFIMRRVNSHEKKSKDQSYITFSGREKNTDDYFKKIAPPLYNDFAIAEKNYYPAYVTVLGQEAASTIEVPEDRIIEKSAKTTEETKPLIKTAKKETKADIRQKEEGSIMEVKSDKNMMPHELERKYLSLIQTAATLVNNSHDVKNDTIKPASQNETSIKETPIVEQDNKANAVSERRNLTVGEKPEVIAMARRITLRDYRVEGAQKTVGRRATYFERSSAQLEKLMSTNERFAPVERLIPGSKFVKVNYDQKRYYIVGVIGRDYICYGVPAVYSEVPPEPLNGYARWLPFNADKPHAEGFWMMYQDGISGETLKS